MILRTTAFIAAAALVVAAAAAPAPTAAAEPQFHKIPSKGVTLAKKSGYWAECRGSGADATCKTVYARTATGKFRKLPAGEGILKNKAGQVLVCYPGSNNAEICYWVYSPRGL